jgi:hypothetical protein
MNMSDMGFPTEAEGQDGKSKSRHSYRKVSQTMNYTSLLSLVVLGLARSMCGSRESSNRICGRDR